MQTVTAIIEGVRLADVVDRIAEDERVDYAAIVEHTETRSGDAEYAAVRVDIKARGVFGQRHADKKSAAVSIVRYLLANDDDVRTVDTF